MDLRSRMEERRKKILENAEARMSIILGRPYVTKEATDQFDGSTSIYSLNNGISNGATSSCLESSNSNSTTHEQRLLGCLDERNEESTANIQALNSSTEYSNTLVFICLGLLARLCYLIEISWLFSENLMLPFFIVGIPWTYMQLRDKVQIGGMIAAVLLYYGVPQVTVIKLCKVMAFFRMLSQYFSLYLFCFIMLHCSVDCILPINT